MDGSSWRYIRNSEHLLGFRKVLPHHGLLLRMIDSSARIVRLGGAHFGVQLILCPDLPPCLEMESGENRGEE